MKKSILLIIVLLFCSNISDAQWNIRSTDDIGTLMDVFFINKDIGWAVGMYGTVSNSPSTILKTIDGGKSWFEQQTTARKYLQSVCFTDENNGICIGQDGALLSTSNGGNDWNNHTMNPDYSLEHIFFVSKTEGWIAGYNDNIKSSVILKTTDGGKNWIEQYISTPYYELQDIYFTDEVHGWILCANSMIMRTVDGGKNWTSHDPYISKDLWSINFIDDMNGWACGGSYDRMSGSLSIIIHTSDGGKTWETQSENLAYELHDIQFVDNKNGWAVGGAPALGGGTFTSLILCTTDGGKTWQTQDPVTSTIYTGLHLYDKYNGCIVGLENCGNGIILQTENGGVSAVDSKVDLTDISIAPNPFTESTSFLYQLSEPALVTIKVYDALGNEVAELVNEFQDSGVQSCTFSGDNLPSGVYYYSMQIGNGVQTGKVILVR